MKILVVYYSLSGNTGFIAQAIASSVGADMLRLKPKREVSPRGFMKYIWGGAQVMMNTKPDLEPFDAKPAAYEIIFIGTPVWAFRHAPAIETFLSTIDIKGKRIGLFCCHGGGKGATFARLRERLAGNQIIGEIDFREPLRQNRQEFAAQAGAWARTITG